MSVTTAVGERELDGVFDSIRQVLHAERNRTETEIEAFEEFANRVADLLASRDLTAECAGGLQEAGGTVALKSEPMPHPTATGQLDTIKNAYTETVMSLPFYEAEYGDTYEESIREEFGPDVAIALTQSDCFSPAAEQILLAKIKQAIAERRTLIETCEREHESVDEAATVLKPIGKELRSVESISLDHQGFGALEAYRARLLTIEDKCEQVVTARQATIHHHRTEYSLPVDAPDICAYLYEEFETAYPVLYLCSDLAERVENRRQQVERAMSTCS